MARGADIVIALHARDAMPSCSWWIGLDREAFTAARLKEQTRMSYSKHGAPTYATLDDVMRRSSWSTRRLL